MVRQISAAQDIGGWYLQLFIADSAEATNCSVFLAFQAGEVNYLAGEGRWVVPGGGFIYLDVSEIGDYPSFYVGGYLLYGTGPDT